jgi:hypothetical protein
MFPLNFQKQRAEYYLKCLDDGTMIEPDQAEGWTVDEMVALAGACFLGLLSHGPLLRKAACELKGETVIPPEAAEHREADDELIANDLHGAIEFVGSLTALVRDEEYDDSFEEVIRCLVTQVGNVRGKVMPFEGFKSR